MRRPILTLTLAIILTAACGIARADYVTNHTAGGHGPLSAAGAMPVWGEVELCCTPLGGGERWLGDESGNSYLATPTAGQTWVRKSSAPNTYAVAYEHATYPYGHTMVVSSSWNAVALPWTIAVVDITYNVGCPLTPGMNTAHVCSGDWTPIDAGGLPTLVIGNGIVKPGLPYGDYLKDTSGGNPGRSWCSFNFSDFPGVTKPAGMPNTAVAVDACP